MNVQRLLVGLFAEICEERGISFEVLHAGWIFRLSKAGQSRYVFGYDFPLNNATAQMIARHKAATAELLRLNNVPCVPHHVFHFPQSEGFVPGQGNWRSILDLFSHYECDVVCKSDKGSGGTDIYRARTVNELEEAVHILTRKFRPICLSPYIPIENEYRIIILDGRIELVYAKQRPVLWGDGKSTLHQLVTEHLKAQVPHQFSARLNILHDNLRDIDTSEILKLGQPFCLNWRHNLSQGSRAQLIDPNDDKLNNVGSVALLAAQSIDIDFAAVDVVEAQGCLRVLEINSGIMMESLISQYGSEVAKRLYGKAIDIMFSPSRPPGYPVPGETRA